MADVFNSVFGQPKVRTYLRQSVDAGRTTHAYLFVGPAGSSKLSAAKALASALLCKDGGCGECEACRRIAKDKHPDVQLFRPEGATGYLVEQIRGIVADVSLAPIQAAGKVYILDGADMLSSAAANAFLKTLEEPPAGVVLILLARTVESVLPTVLSRCQVVPFRHIPTSEACGMVCQYASCTADRARYALAACDGSIDRAVAFAKSNERLAFRNEVLDVLGSLATADEWDILQASQKLVLSAKLPLAEVQAEQEAQLERDADFLSASARRQIELRNKRTISAKSAESFGQILSVAKSWLRDAMCVCLACPEHVVNADAMEALQAAASRTDEARVAAACAAVDGCAESFRYNVSPQTCLDALLLRLQLILYGTDMMRR